MTFEIRHSLRAIDYDRAAGLIAARYYIREQRVWQEWPCGGHGCGNSEIVSQQNYDLTWSLHGNSEPVELRTFGEHVEADSRSARRNVGKAFAVGDLTPKFSPDYQLGGLRVHQYDATSCWRALPCFVDTPDEGHLLIVDKIYSLDTAEPVIDLSDRKGFHAFVAAAVQQFSYLTGELPGRRPSIGYAVSNDLRFIAAFPKNVGCPTRLDVHQSFNSVLLFDVTTDTFAVHALPTSGSRQPTARYQQVFFSEQGVHYVSQFAEWFETADGGDCRLGYAPLVVDVLAGTYQDLDATAYLVGTGTSTDGAAKFDANFIFEKGVIQLRIFDIPRNRRFVFELALPNEILDQVSADLVRPDIVNGEFIRL